MTLLEPAHFSARPNAISEALAQAREALGTACPDVLLVNDPQRATATAAVLAAAQAFFDLSRTRVVVATGSHSFNAAARAVLQQTCPGFPVEAWSWH